MPVRASPLALSLTLIAARAMAEGAEATPARELTSEEIDAWLESRSMPTTADSGAGGFEEAPPPPPQKRGVVLEGSLGALGHFGPLKNVSPLAPWFHVKVGFEALDWLMPFLEADLVLANTSYAEPPPPERSYALPSFGGGLRFTARPGRFGLYAQGDAGGAVVTEDVLAIYGYRNATSLQAYFGGQVGFEWYQVNPHYALAVHGGVRDYPTLLARERSSQPPLTWLAGVALRYTF